MAYISQLIISFMCFYDIIPASWLLVIQEHVHWLNFMDGGTVSDGI